MRFDVYEKGDSKYDKRGMGVLFIPLCAMVGKRLFIVVNVDWFFLSHRKNIALAAQSSGWDVTIVTADTGKLKDTEALGLKVINLPISCSGMNIREELKYLNDKA